MKLRFYLPLVLGVACHSPSPTSQASTARAGCTGDTTRLNKSAPSRRVTRRLARGLVYECRFDPAGPWSIHVVRVQLPEWGSRLDVVHGGDAFGGRERISAIAARRAQANDTLLVALNGDFFDLATGEVENTQVDTRGWLKGVVKSDSPHDAFDGPHAHVVVTPGGSAAIDRYVLDATLGTSARDTARIAGVNHRPPEANSWVVYTSRFGASTPVAGRSLPEVAASASDADRRADATRRQVLRLLPGALEVPVRAVEVEEGEYVLTPLGLPQVGGGSRIPEDGMVVSVVGADTTRLRAWVTSTPWRLRLRLAPGNLRPRIAIGGWPMLQHNGFDVSQHVDSIEGTFPRFSASRHPRSGLGLSRDGRTLFLVVVDGRRDWSVGMTLPEFSSLLRQLGAHNAMNLDGGGSSALWIDGALINRPSDASGERAVGNALVISRSPRPTR